MTDRSHDEAPGRPSHIVIVDDNLLDARATRRALENLARPADVHHLADGSEALAYLIDESNSHERPDLVLLDLNLPGLRGLEILRWVTTDPSIAAVPVMILTTSEHEADIEAAHQLGASAYLVKPREIDGWSEIIDTIDELMTTEAA